MSGNADVALPARAPRLHAGALVAPVLAAVAVGAVAAAQGGYFPTSWGWSSLAFLWTLGLWLVVGGRSDAGRADLVFLAALTVLVAWIGLSIAWSSNPASSVLELERALVPLSGCAAFAALARRDALDRLALALLTAITLVSAYSLATRLFPDRLGSFDPIATYRLSDPIGYWNGLAIFAAIGILLALGLAASVSVGWAARAGAAVALVVLPVALFYTYSRASWIALAVGAVVLLAVSPTRLRLVGRGLPLLAVPAVAVLLASRAHALTHLRAPLPEATHDGHRLALWLLVLAALGALSTVPLALFAPHLRLSPRARGVVGGAMLVAAVALAVGVVVHAGGPVRLAQRTHDAFVAAPTEGRTTNLNERLRSFSGNGRADLWRYTDHVYAAHPVLGTGAGTFERSWQANTRATFKVRDAHSLYLETLTELGPIGLTLLVVVLTTPLVAGVRARRHAVVAPAMGGYAAFLLHAGVDWDWELSGVTLTALLVGSLALVAARTARPRPPAVPARAAGVAAVAAASGLAVVGLLGNSALAHTRNDTEHGQVDAALTQAARARRWMPWSPQPWIAQAEAQITAGDRAAARRSLRKAISIDAREWTAWLELAVASDGRARAQALAHARRLYPRSAEIADAAARLEAQAKTRKG